MITENKAKLDFELYKTIAKDAYKRRDFKKTINALKWACNIAYCLNLCYRDEEIEDLISSVSTHTISTFHMGTKKGRYVFYDSFGNTRVLTLQYLRALMAMNAEILYITTYREVDSLIKNIFKNYPKGKVCICNTDDPIQQAKVVSERVAQFMPKCAFLQMHPWDMTGCIVWNAFPKVERYQINLTDHTFWVGTNCMDYSLEFRDYGCQISNEYRGIHKSRILLQPYYPILEDGEFQGLPDDDGKTRLFSGGVFYKIYGQHGKFLHLIEHILTENPSTVFYYAGSGDNRPMQRFIEKHYLQDRWHILGHRPDIIKVMSKMDIYIGTYPYGGGLMTQIAAACATPMVSYTYTPDSIPEDMFLKGHELPKISYNNENEFYAAVKELINDRDLCKKKGEQLRSALPTEEGFNSRLYRLIHTKENDLHWHLQSLYLNEFRRLYFEAENDFLHIYSKNLITDMFFRKRPFRTIRAGIDYAIHHPNKRELIKRAVLKVLKNDI